jgi:hypothetical protein
MTTAAIRLSRRQALISTGLVGTGVLGAILSGRGGFATVATTPSPDKSHAIAGAWFEDWAIDNGIGPGRASAGVPDLRQAVTLYMADGGVASILSCPASTFSACLGTWNRSGDKYVITTQRFAFDYSEAETGVLRIRALATIDQTGHYLSGEADLDFQSARRSKFVPYGSARFTARHINGLAL